MEETTDIKQPDTRRPVERLVSHSLSVTMTGVDVHTDLQALPDDIEIGVLFTKTTESRHRYPARRDAERILSELDGRRVALHVCGRAARDSLMRGELADLTSRVQRLQVNGRVTPDELQHICRQYARHTVITQHTTANADLIGVECDNHVVLVDGSGGRGISPAAWFRPVTRKNVGFAGGLGPENIVGEITRIRGVACGEWWIDMEGKLRDENDWFDVRRACDVMSCLNG